MMMEQLQIFLGHFSQLKELQDPLGRQDHQVLPEQRDRQEQQAQADQRLRFLVLQALQGQQDQLEQLLQFQAQAVLLAQQDQQEHQVPQAQQEHQALQARQDQQVR